MQHARWDKSGRTLIDGGRFIYSSSIGQQMVEVSPGEYAPYVFDLPNKTLKVANIRFTLEAGGIAVYEDEVFKFRFRFHPEIFKSNKWNRLVPTVKNLIREEVDELSSTPENKISYEIDTPDVNGKLTLSVVAGIPYIIVSREITNKSTKDEDIRLSLEADIPELAQVNETRKDGVLRQKELRYPELGWKLRWPGVDDADTQVIDNEVNTTLLLNQKTYSPGEKVVVHSTTWGPTAISQDGNDAAVDATTWYLSGYDSDGSYYWESTSRCDWGMRWENVTVPQGASIEDGTLVQLFSKYSGGGTYPKTITLYCEDTDDAAIFSTLANFNARVKTTDSDSKQFAGAPTDEAYFTSSTNLKVPIQEVINRAGWASGNDLAVLTVASTSNSATLECQDYGKDATKGAKLTIIYSADAGKTGSGSGSFASTGTASRRLGLNRSATGIF